MSRKGSRAWLRYPPRIVNAPPSCPSGEAAFRSADDARWSVPAWAHLHITPTTCTECPWWHLTDKDSTS